MQTCWALRKAGVDDARIADRLSITVVDVEHYISLFEGERAMVSGEMIDNFINLEVMRALEGAGSDLREARMATRYTGRDDKEGNPIMERDWNTMIASVQASGELLDRVRPKGGGVNVAVGIQNTGNGMTGTVRTFEQRVREKRELLAGGNSKLLSDGNRLAVADAVVQDADEAEPEYMNDGADTTDDDVDDNVDELEDEEGDGNEIGN